jgi:6-phosphogluconolactonase (cycloisomerase 2 family)
MIYPTGGTGTGDGLGNQGAVVLSAEGKWLIVCNAGSDELSVFSVDGQNLMLSDKVNSQGQRPVSVTLHRNLVYVLNAGGAEGGSDNVAGFLFVCGRLYPLAGSLHPLSGPNTGPAQIGFTQDGRHLVVTEKATALIDVFALGDCGEVASHQMFLSPDPPPFGFAAGKHDRIYVSQANGGDANPGASSVSSYLVTDEGGLETITDSVATHQTAACWVVLSPDQRFAYTANTPNDSISSLAVRRDGQLELRQSQAALTGSGSGPVDMAFSRGARFLYSLNAGNGTVGAFRQNSGNGALHPLGGASGLPAGCNGLAAQ